MQRKDGGGLGLKRPVMWNKTAMPRHVWSILEGDEKNVWVAWMKQYKLKGRSIWTVRNVSNSSWVWKNLLATKYIMRPLTSWRMGDGSRISFWDDNWLGLGDLRSKIPVTCIAASDITPWLRLKMS
ncbi:hypothetical protein MLD38_003933 [Melastoma candidum]|uniref:Uncharacterized protein n=1 Tax=Melastoma candidum TaxID=119954 RepID=A0ACB9S481_9MYRT|nr:hypothetical protein MLD38_003933 [Melastoma candidum]